MSIYHYTLPDTEVGTYSLLAKYYCQNMEIGMI